MNSPLRKKRGGIPCLWDWTVLIDVIDMLMDTIADIDRMSSLNPKKNEFYDALSGTHLPS